MKNNKKLFSTDNFQLAAYLLAESCKLVSFDRSDPKRVIFMFEESQERKLLTEKFMSYSAKLEPHRYFSAQKDLKQMIYQNK